MILLFTPQCIYSCNYIFSQTGWHYEDMQFCMQKLLVDKVHMQLERICS